MSDRTPITDARSDVAEFSARARERWEKTSRGARFGLSCATVLVVVAVVAVANRSTDRSTESDRSKAVREFAAGLIAPPYLNMPPQLPVSEGSWQAVPAFPHIRLHNATFLTGAPRTERLFVCEREGRIVSFDNDPATTQSVTFLDIRSRCQGWDDCGLMGLAFHPDFGRSDSPNRGYVYVSYQFSENPTPGPDRVFPPHPVTRNRLARFTVPEGSNVADPESELVLIDQTDRSLWHNGGAVLFGAHDGYLYLSLGDEGGGEKFENDQRIDKDLFAGVIRIDVDCDPARSHPPTRQPEHGQTAHYFIPNDNPFVGVTNALEEFWCLGLRSPHRMTQDPITGEIWVGDVGHMGADSREEVNLIRKGANYQWDYREGTVLRKPPPAAIPGIEQPPVYEYPRTNGNRCVIGGYVYRGAEHASDLGGKYIFGDNASGRIWAMQTVPGETPLVLELCTLPANTRSYSGLSSFGVDNRGELYLCVMGEPRRSGGGILRLERAGSSGPPVPRLLSQTGVFRDTRSLTPAAGVLPYEINLSFWSDGAEKRRWIGLPRNDETKRIGPIARTWYDELTFPAGTVFVKHFDLPGFGPNGAARRLETRILVRDPCDSVYGVTYKWRPDETDAELVEQGTTEEIAAADSDRKQVWFYPGSSDCQTCHNATARYILGVNIRQLNRQIVSPIHGTEENQLQTWNCLQFFEPPLDESRIASMPRHPAIDDERVDVESRVRAYLDVNCAACHRPDEVRAAFNACVDAPFGRNIINGVAYSAGSETGLRIVAPADPQHSLLLQRMRSEGDNRMPPIARNRADGAAVHLIEQWISQMPADRTAEDLEKAPAR